MNNYLLGWYFFANSAHVRDSFRASFLQRGVNVDHDGALIDEFGGVWCFTSLLHDVGYLLEGNIPDASVELIDEGIRNGADRIRYYFTELFWRELGLHRIDLRRTAMSLAQLDLDALTANLGAAGDIISFLRNLGNLDTLKAALDKELGGKALATLPRDAIALWSANYRAIGQTGMAERIEGMEEALYSLVEKGLPSAPAVRALDHGVCGGLLLLKWSTLWHAFSAALRSASPVAGSPEEEVKKQITTLMDKWPQLFAPHWWSGVLWGTAAVALHNVQQDARIPGWKKKLEFAEDPLTYLEILVDLLQEWDRPSSRRVNTVGGERRRLNAGDVKIGASARGQVTIEFGCRDGKHAERQAEKVKELDGALADWQKLVSILFVPVH